MSASSSTPSAGENGRLEVLWEDGERVFCSILHRDADGGQSARLAVLTAGDQRTPGGADRLVHEFGLRSHLDGAWALRPLDLVRESGRTMLLVEWSGGEPLYGLIGSPMEVGQFLRIAIGLSAALRGLHEGGLVHKDIKPSNVVVDAKTGKAWLTGFGIASRIPRERQLPEPPELIAGTLAYMAPEQTGRMNRSIDSRSDLYALGVTLYQMLTGLLPFMAADPMDWVHCHIARIPVPPSERVTTVPDAISAVVMKLLAKAAEQRYQTAAGLERDLRHCLAEWDDRAFVEVFLLAQRDMPDRLLIPEKLYGRDDKVAALNAAFARCCRSGKAELVLVSGYSGVGKSSVVNELHKVLVPSGLFAAGKFDEHKRDIPYAILAQAFQSLINLLLSKSDTELKGWRVALLDALGENGQLMIELVPELRLIIGDQPPILDLPSQQAQRRLQLVFRCFVGVFARVEHPLALFLDDLQWLDAATLDLIEDLLLRSDPQHLLLIGAYRDNEVDATHPLVRKLELIRSAGVRLEHITLVPLDREHVDQFVADALCCEPARAMPVTQLVHEKTAGNPFFVIQFLSALVDEGLVSFDREIHGWSWELGQIRAKGYTDNVADLMAARLSQLSSEVLSTLQQLSCLGDGAETSRLAAVIPASETEVRAALWEAVRQDLVEPLDGCYRFRHDRVREAAYASLSEEQRATAHLRIGRLLIAHTPAEEQEEAIFEIVNQLNRGAGLIDSGEARQQLAEFNLKAGRRAQASTAYESAIKYFAAGQSLLPYNGWENHHDLTFSLELHRAECEFLSGVPTDAETRLAALSGRTLDTIRRAAVTCLQIDVYLTRNEGSRAIGVALDHLRHVGIRWSEQPDEQEVRGAYDRVRSDLSQYTDEELIALPMMTDGVSRSTLDVLTKLTPPAFFFDINLFSLAVCEALALTLSHGNCDASPAAYARLGIIAASRFGDYEGAYRVGKLGCDLVDRLGLRRHQASTYVNFAGQVSPWRRHLRVDRDLFRRGFDAASANGDPTYAVFSLLQESVNRLSAGDPLAEIQTAIENAVVFAQRLQFLSGVVFLETNLVLVRTLRGSTLRFGCFDDSQFDELQMEGRFADNPHLVAAEFWYWVRKLQARFLAGDCTAALDAATEAQRLLKKSVSTLEAVDFHFYSALCRAACCDSLPVERRVDHIGALIAHHRQFELWAASCPENFEAQATLLAAEVARLAGCELDAEHLYEQSIRSARVNGFVQNEALACELASRFYAARGFEIVADAYLRQARHGYARWGADGKVRQLDQLYPQIRLDEVSRGPSSTIVASAEHLDLATVIKVSQAVSGEIVLEKLLETLMRMAIAQAGAERGSLILLRSNEQWVAAQATTEETTVFVHRRDETVAFAALPVSIIQFVVHTCEPVILDDASARSPFADDEYVRQRHARSVLCLPLANQGRLIGVLYLENNLAARVFTPTRMAVLKLLASQAAVAVENASLYRDVAEREAKIRRLVDANIIGTFIWKV
jgi:predicted ATPase/GAF domain-containing protein